MNNKEKYDNIFIEVFGLDQNDVNDSLSKDTVDSWDSVHQLSLIGLMEEAFDLMLDPEDIMAMTSYSKGVEILANNGIEL